MREFCDVLITTLKAGGMARIAFAPEQVWARTQGIAEQPDSVSGFLLSMLAAYLAASGSLVSPPSLIWEPPG